MGVSSHIVFSILGVTSIVGDDTWMQIASSSNLVAGIKNILDGLLNLWMSYRSISRSWNQLKPLVVALNLIVAYSCISWHRRILEISVVGALMPFLSRWHSYNPKTSREIFNYLMWEAVWLCLMLCGNFSQTHLELCMVRNMFALSILSKTRFD